VNATLDSSPPFQIGTTGNPHRDAFDNIQRTPDVFRKSDLAPSRITSRVVFPTSHSASRRAPTPQSQQHPSPEDAHSGELPVRRNHCRPALRPKVLSWSHGRWAQATFGDLQPNDLYGRIRVDTTTYPTASSRSNRTSAPDPCGQQRPRRALSWRHVSAA
jgi:hypothetical protein